MSSSYGWCLWQRPATASKRPPREDPTCVHPCPARAGERAGQRTSAESGGSRAVKGRAGSDPGP